MTRGTVYEQWLESHRVSWYDGRRVSRRQRAQEFDSMREYKTKFGL
jgi:hypothetical protein